MAQRESLIGGVFPRRCSIQEFQDKWSPQVRCGVNVRFRCSVILHNENGIVLCFDQGSEQLRLLGTLMGESDKDVFHCVARYLRQSTASFHRSAALGRTYRHAIDPAARTLAAHTREVLFSELPCELNSMEMVIGVTLVATFSQLLSVDWEQRDDICPGAVGYDVTHEPSSIIRIPRSQLAVAQERGLFHEVAMSMLSELS